MLLLGGMMPRSKRSLPEEPPSSATVTTRRPRYWLRWLLVIGIVLGLVGGVSYAMIASAAWVRNTIRSQDDAVAASQSHTDYPTPAACDAAQLRISLDAPKETSVGAGMGIDVTVTNEGGDACLLDVGGASLGAVIVSGDQTVWSSTSCLGEDGGCRSPGGCRWVLQSRAW